MADGSGVGGNGDSRLEVDVRGKGQGIVVRKGGLSPREDELVIRIYSTARRSAVIEEVSIASKSCAATDSWDAAGLVGGRAAGESPDGSVVVALEGIDVDVELRLGLLQRSQSKQSCGDYKGAECQTFTACGGGGGR